MVNNLRLSVILLARATTDYRPYEGVEMARVFWIKVCTFMGEKGVLHKNLSGLTSLVRLARVLLVFP